MQVHKTVRRMGDLNTFDVTIKIGEKTFHVHKVSIEDSIWDAQIVHLRIFSSQEFLSLETFLILIWSSVQMERSIYQRIFAVNCSQFCEKIVSMYAIRIRLDYIGKSP